MTLTKAQKIAALSKAMTQSKRDDESEFYHFTDEAPEELKNKYLEHYEVRDIDYQTFSEACDIVHEIYKSNPDMTEEDAREEISERTSDCASVYTADRLGYLNIWNEDEISDVMREYGMKSIADACAVWYDRQVEQAAGIINEWVNA